VDRIQRAEAVRDDEAVCRRKNDVGTQVDRADPTTFSEIRINARQEFAERPEAAAGRGGADSAREFESCDLACDDRLFALGAGESTAVRVQEGHTLRRSSARALLTAEPIPCVNRDMARRERTFFGRGTCASRPNARIRARTSSRSSWVTTARRSISLTIAFTERPSTAARRFRRLCRSSSIRAIN
jgi:hypothetical protein